MRARAGALLILIVAAVAAVAAGCGSDKDRDGYVQALNAAQSGLSERFAALQKQVTATSTAAQDKRTLSAYQSAVTTTVKDLRAIQPPAGLETLHRTFTAQVAGYGTALEAARAQLDGADPQKVLAAQSRLRAAATETGKRLDATIRAINDKLQS